MRSVAFVIASMVAACGVGKPGVALEVTADVPIDRVELFVATSGCYEPADCAGKTTPECELARDCEGGIAWASDITRPRGRIFFMIEDEQRIATERVEHGRFVMHLQATPAAATPHVMAIVGFRDEIDESGEVAAVAVAYQLLRYPYVHIPLDHAEVWQVHLPAADVASDDTATEPTASQRHLRVHAWERKRVEAPHELSRCLAVQSWDKFNQDWKSLFIVPASDPDCDGQVPECNAGHADFNADGRELACVTTGRSGQFGDICVLGGSRCADGSGGRGGCSYTPNTPSAPMHCFPSDACGRCAGRDDDVASCLYEAIQEDRILHAACAVAIDSSGRACGVSVGVGAPLRIEMRGPCIAGELRYPHAPLTPAIPPLVAGLVKIDEYKTYSSPNGICYLEVSWSGTATQNQVARFLAVLFTGTNYLYVPVRLEFAATPNGCNNTSPAMCIADASLTSDSIADCF